jgi:hypothetical protein
VHAEAPDVHAAARLNHIQRVGREFFIPGLIHGEIVVGAESSQSVGGQEVAWAGFEQAIDKFTGHNTTLASNAASRIDKD